MSQCHKASIIGLKFTIMREAVFIVVRLDLDFKCFKTYITSTFKIKNPTMENKRTIREYGRCQGAQ